MDEEFMKMDLYVYLEISKDATKAEIKKAYHSMSLKLHPDHNKAPNASELFVQLNRIYSFLKDDKNREIYDKARQQQEIRKRKIEEAGDERQALLKQLAKREEAAKQAKLNEQKMTDIERVKAQTEIFIQELMKDGRFDAPTPLSSVSSTFASVKSSSSSSSKRTCAFGAFASSSAPSIPASSPSSEAVVIAWKDKRDKTWKDELRGILEKHGRVNQLMVLKKRALCVFASKQQAEQAVRAHADDPVLTFAFKPLDSEGAETEETPSQPKPTYVPPEPVRGETYEMQTLMRLRTAQLSRQQPEVASTAWT